MSSERLRLISFKLCPFVQRTVINLLERGIDYDIEYIKLDNKPEWFRKISPLGKVPVLEVGDEVLYESSVINEYLDEVYPPQLLPEEPLVRARHRAWIEFASNLLTAQHQLSQARRQETYLTIEEDLDRKYRVLEKALAGGDYFAGDQFSLVDTAFAPFFMRSAILQKVVSNNWFDRFPKIDRWQQTLLKRPSVKKSVVKDFEELYLERINEREGYLADLT